MGAQANLTLNSHTFVPAGVDSDGVATWIYSTTGVPSGNESVQLQVRRPLPPGRNGSNSNRVYRVTIGLSKPIVQADDTAFAPAGTILRKHTASCDIVLPETSSTAERTDVYTVLKDFFANAVAASAIEDLVAPTS